MAFALDSSVVQRALSGDESALHEIVIAAKPHIERQLLRYPVSDDDRRDLAQTTLMQVLRRLGSFRGDSSFSTWLFRVTANEALMLMRSQRRLRARIADVDFDAAVEGRPAEGVDPAAYAVRGETSARVASALAALPHDYREVVLAHYEQDLGLQEIADRLDLTESAVRSRLHRARARLRTLLDAA